MKDRTDLSDGYNPSSGPIRIKKKKSFFILLILAALFFAVAVWIVAIRENNTVTDVSLVVSGNERLMANNLSVASIEPSSVDIVLRGKRDTIKRIMSDKSLITAKVNLFKSSLSSAEPDHYVFENADQVKAGVYTVMIDISLPDGVTCMEREVQVTISETASRKLATDMIRHTVTNISFPDDCTINSVEFDQQFLTVSGDVHTVERIASLTVTSNWSKEITGDTTIDGLIPVAYDEEGEEIDSRFLRFEPAALKLNISVNRRKSIALTIVQDERDTSTYTLSRKEVLVSGPSKLINKLSDVYEINKKTFEEGDHEIAASYTVYPADVAKTVPNGALYEKDVRFTDLADNEIDSVAVYVTKTDRRQSVEISVSKDDWIILTDSGYVCSEVEEYVFSVSFIPIDPDRRPVLSDFVFALDLRGKTDGERTAKPLIGIKRAVDFLSFDVEDAGTINVTLEKAKSSEPTEPTPAEGS